MTSIGKLIPSLASGLLELQPALVNLNFDFALWKLAAPKEFEGVGSALSSRRREEAENGMLHTMARKLGALFERKVPSTPGLTKAYGTRASEIAQALSLNERDRDVYGVFASQAGADATSIWAAATSGSGAIAVHLLACLLARMWDAPEATSIWVEIINKRKEEVIAQFEEADIASIATLHAARQDFLRAQIAEWDASARAWLRVADREKFRQQTQLKLIVNNIRTLVNGMTDTYISVMEAWNTSLLQMEALVQGVAQQARNGGIILALSAWHLYPDMTVVKPSISHVRQHDPVFISGGVLTLGLETPSPQDTGICWSLPLAHLRHYGAPVVRRSSMHSESRSRLSLPELLQATLGCLLQSWGAAGSDTPRVLSWLSSMYSLLDEATTLGSKEASLLTSGIARFSWLALMSGAAKVYLDSTDIERQYHNKLISLGRKHGKTFLGSTLEPLFGLVSEGRFAGLIRREEDKIAFLRKIGKAIAKQMQLDGSQIFIRYRHSLPGPSSFAYEYATAVPLHTKHRKRKADEPETQPLQSHHRWLYAGGSPFMHQPSRTAYINRGPPDLLAKPYVEALYAASADQVRCSNLDTKTMEIVSQDYKCRKSVLETSGEVISRREDQCIEDLRPRLEGVYWAVSGQSVQDDIPPRSDPWFRFMYGSIDDAALFVTERCEPFIKTDRPLQTRAHEMYSLFERKQVDGNLLASELLRLLRSARIDADPHLKSLKAISTAAKMFKHFPYASVDVRVLQQSLYNSSWVRTCVGQQSKDDQYKGLRVAPEALDPYALSKAQAFSCITMFESGQFDVDPLQLVDVMAMSSGDLIYVSAELLEDPYERVEAGNIKGFVGNIGKPGISFMVPPQDPMIKEVDLADWPFMERNEFDGRLVDYFGSTSLHLSFTTAETPLNLGFSGGQDREAYIVETLFSVYDEGKWIADLNIGRSTSSTMLSRLPSCTSSCVDPHIWGSRITCIDSWLALVDAPEERISLVRAHGNWQARLAASSVSLALDYQTVILPERVCWQCFDRSISQFYKKIVAIG